MKIKTSSKETVEGFAFADFIKSERISKRKQFSNFLRSSDIRIYLLPISLILVVGILFVRLSFLQIFQGSYYRNLSNSNRIKTLVIHAPRGIIFDRNGIPLVFNVPGYRQVVNTKTILLNRDEALNLIAKGNKQIEVDSLRSYPYKDAFAHVLGYIGQISEDELKNDNYSFYLVNDLIGKSGIEKSYESLLKGVDGKELVEVNSVGNKIRTLGQTEPIAGKDITLTIDKNLQLAAYLAIKDVKKGAVVVSNPKGEILALVSKPSFDANLFTMDKTYEVSTDSSYETIESVLFDSSNQPLLNRAISGLYPPGSTFKLITAAAGLEGKIIDKDYKVEDTGILKIGEFSFGNWYYLQYGKKEGFVDVVLAIKRSNDIFFYKLAEKIGVDRLSKMAEKFGLGKILSIDLEGEKKGILPSTKWKKETIGEQWYLGDTYHFGIGQGYLLTTPLQVNSWTQVIANNGNLYVPHLSKNTTNTTNTTNNPIKKNLISEKTRDLIREGMIESCSEGGVAWPLFKFKVQNAKLKIDGKNFREVSDASGSAQISEISIACKTGTAQHGGEQTLPHAWITLFAPAYDPQIIVTVLAESSGEGSNIAAPIAKKILEAYFSQ